MWKDSFSSLFDAKHESSEKAHECDIPKYGLEETHIEEHKHLVVDAFPKENFRHLVKAVTPRLFTGLMTSGC